MTGVGNGGFAAVLGAWRGEPGRHARTLADAIREAILDGRVPVGTRLPSERALAAALRLSRGTVVATLSQLRHAGWVRTRHGSGTITQLPAELVERTAPRSMDHADGLDLTRAVPAAPHTAYLAATQRAVHRSAPLLVDSGQPDTGLPELRELVADRYTESGLPTRPDQILITAGARAALTLLAEHLHDRTRPVLVENPTYHGLLAILRRRRARLTVLPVTDHGWDLARLTHTITTVRPALAFLTPDFHNPTGTLMPPAQRRGVARLANRHDVTFVVDETLRDLDLRTPAQPIPHLAARRVINVGSTSKLIWGGLRVGWLRTDATRIRDLMHNPLAARLSPPPLEQLIACELLAAPDQIRTDRRNQLRAQRDHLAGLLTGSPAWSFTTPTGGLSLWLKLHHTTGHTVATQAAREGLKLSPGPAFSADRTLTNHLRLPYTATPDTLTHAVAILSNSAQPARRPPRPEQPVSRAP